jgi:hypothetical protein
LPTHEEADQFWADWEHLSADERRLFREAVKKLAEDLVNLPPGQFRRGLRVKPMQAAPGIFEMTSEIRDGRATFEYGPHLTQGDPHIVWRRIGGHAIFGDP